MPVVRMHDVGGLVGQRGRDRPAKEGVALRIVRRAVHLVAADALVRDEHDTHAIADDLGIGDPHVGRAVRHRTLAALGGDAPLLAIDRAVQGDVERDVAAKPRECLGQGAGDIGEPADLREGRGFGGGEGDPERLHHRQIVSSS